MTHLPKIKRIVDEVTLEAIRSLPCMGCISALSQPAAEAAVREGGCRSHPHHLKSRGAGGGDTLDNLMPLCFKHHQEIHRIGRSMFAAKYQAARGWLRAIEENRDKKDE